MHTPSVGLVALCTLLVGCAAAPAGAERLTLAENGRTTAGIVLAAKPTRAAQFAAAELQYHLRKMTGAEVPIVTDAGPLPRPAILVGESAATRALDLKGEGFAPQEYLIGLRPGALVLMGRDAPDFGPVDYQNPDTFPGDFAAQGSVYAVYDFLERFGDVRWYLPTELGEVIPARPTLAVEGRDIRRRPAMIYRYVFRGETMPADLIGDTVNHDPPCPELDLRAARLYMRRMRQGGSAYEANHSFEGFYARFHAQHPDWFAQGSSDPMCQLCFTNADVIRQVVADARAYFDTGAIQPRSVAAGDFYALVPMDSADWCKCERCQALLRDKPTRGSARTSNDIASDYVFGFINQVAREVGKTHPGKWLAALAYSQYVYPPKREPLERNVSIMLCLPIRVTYSRERMKNDQRILAAWTQESVERPKFVWLYYCFPSIWASEQDWRPFPGFFAHSIPGRFAQFRRSGVRGFFIEPSYIARGQRSPLMDQLELYLTYHLADDPTLDANREIAEFFERYYGPAAVPMRELYESMEATYADPKNHPGSDIGQTEAQAWLHLGTEERMREYGRRMAKARSLARRGSTAHQQRVALFDRGIYRWMEEGRKSFLHVRALGATPPPSADVARVAGAQGDPERVHWSAAATLAGWRGLRGDATNRHVQARLAHDGEYIYLELEETAIDPRKLVLGADITVWNEDEWEVFFARERGPIHRQMGLNAAGVHYDLAWGEASPNWDSGAVLHSHVSAPDRWTVRMALPLAKLVPGGANPGDTLYFNALRATQMTKALSWSATFGPFREASRFGTIRLAK